MDVIMACARAAHEVNRVYCEVHGDTSQFPWEQAPDWQIESVVAGVSGALSGATPRESHEAWMAHKIKEGWVYGEVKDQFAKTHPCLVPYDELPYRERAKDKLYLTVVRAMHEALSS